MIPLQAPELGQRVAKAYNIRGEPIVIGALEQILFPVTIVDDIRDTSTKRKLIGGAATGTSAAGQVGQVVLFNPLGSGTVCRLKRWCAQVAATQVVEMRLHNPGLSALGSTWDLQQIAQPGGGLGKAFIQFFTVAGGVGDLVFTLNQTATINPVIEAHEGLLLRPGDAVQWNGSALAAVFGLSAVWEEEPV